MDFTEDAVEKEKKYGEKLTYEPSGPFQKTRVRTDFCWLIGFLIFLTVWIIVIIYAFTAGDFDKWYNNPKDASGRVCGKDLDVLDRPVLVSYNPFDCESEKCKVCLSDCPNVDFLYVNKQNSSNNETLEETKQLMICKTEVKIEMVSTWKELDYLVEKEKCAREYRKSKSQNGICNTKEESTLLWTSNGTDSQNVAKIFNDTKYFVIGFILFSVFIGILSIFLLRWYALAFVCLMISALCAALFHCIYEQCVKSAESKTNGVLLSLFICVVILVVIALIIIYWRQQIYLACKIIQVSCKAITSILTSLLIPVLMFIINILILILCLSVFLILETIDSPVYQVELASIENCVCSEYTNYFQNTTCDPEIFKNECKIDGEQCIFSGCFMVDKQSKSMGFLHFINFFGFYWSYLFVSDFGNTILASVFATWYWTFNKKILSYMTVIESFWTISIYHLGTIAFGSLLIVICAIISYILKCMSRTLAKINSWTTVGILLGVKGIFDFGEVFLHIISRRAYIACAIHGTDFLQSARMAFYLLMRNVERVFVILPITNGLTVCITLIISCVTTLLSMKCLSIEVPDQLQIIPLLLIFFGSILATRLLMQTVQMAVNTIFHCFLEDSERHDGSNERPYFMSEELAQFLYKKSNL